MLHQSEILPYESTVLVIAKMSKMYVVLVVDKLSV